jgi:hypothetical protein
MGYTRILTQQSDIGTDDPLWIDDAWLDTVVTVGLTCFILCLMYLSNVSNVFVVRGLSVDVWIGHLIYCACKTLQL